MPNGTRRGHTYHRNGKTFWRGPAQIATPKMAFAAAVVGGGLLLAVGVPQGVVAGLAIASVAGFFAARSQTLRKKVNRWATKRAIAAGRMAAPRKAQPRKAAPRPAGATPAPPYRRPGASQRPGAGFGNPEAWKTGSEPATAKQHHLLTQLRIPFDPSTTTKAQASKLISGARDV
jgi:hypothetical protein